jgi:hypothetical protein
MTAEAPAIDWAAAFDIQALEGNVRDPIAAHLETADADAPRPDFLGTWRVEVDA